MTDALAPLPGEMPSVEKVILPARAFLRSWREQTLPARSAAIADARQYADSLVSSHDLAARDMAILLLIGEALQPLEDLAYLATAWDSPYTGIATYIRATTWARFTANNFWQESKKWNDERLDVFAGFAGRDPGTSQVVPMLEVLGVLGAAIEPAVEESMLAAQRATRARLRRLLETLGRDWKQFSPYFLAYKHGGLVLNRDDVVFVDGDIERVEDDTKRYEPSIAIWTRARRANPVMADFSVDPAEIVEWASGTGRVAVDMCDAFVETRLAVVETIAFSDDGQALGLRGMQVPWTIWLREEDLDRRHWERLGAGPRLRWTPSDSGSSEA